ncbi:hypothetical protein GW17_00041782 [Ensete ventricosum]|nr:hypothetical protein GW17_00041782 [Ensete ventricosum]RZR88365.1 hypothetical protein BHM03_00015935 [Ensete ventricosum]
MQWELAESSPKVNRGSDDIVKSSSRPHQRFVKKFVESSSTGYWEFVGRMLGVRREFAEGNKELTGGLPEGCQWFIGVGINWH